MLTDYLISKAARLFQFVGLVAGIKFWSLRLDFVAKMASSHDATSPCDLLQGLVPKCVLTLTVL